MIEYFKKRNSFLYDKIGNPIKIKQRKERVSLLFVLLFLLGVILLVYPYLGNEWNKMTNTTAVEKYKYLTTNFSPGEIDTFFSEADQYNLQLSNLVNPFENFRQIKNYNDILNVDGAGMMGYVRIPVIGVYLAIYHGFSDDILDRACGHLEGSSFPVGGKSTHAVISAHRGLPSAKLFSDLNKLEIGQTFSIEVLDKTLYYKVDQIKICNPSDSTDLEIIAGEDHVTLLTCTPYGINTHRLLVRGVRCDNPYGFFSSFRDEAFRLDPRVVCLILGILLFLLFLAWSLLRFRPKIPQRNVDLDELERQFIINRIGEFACNFDEIMYINEKKDLMQAKENHL